MKKLLGIFLVLVLAALTGCQQSKPVDAAKTIMSQQLPGHKGLDLDTSKLSYELIEEEGDSAKVAVSGPVQVKGELLLIKEGGKWVLAGKGAGGTKAMAAHKGEAAEHQ
jgi:hypothetical protein